MPEHDRRATRTAARHVEPRHVAIRRAVCIRRFELHRAVGLAEAQACQRVDGQAQAVHADEIVAPLVRVVAEGVSQKGFPMWAAQFPLDRAGEFQYVACRPLRQDAGVHHQEPVFEDGQRLVTQPCDEFVAIGSGEDVGDRVSLAGFAHARSYRQQVDIVVAQDGARAPGLAKRDDLAQRGERLRASVDEVADEAKGGVGGESGQQRLEGGAAALEVADGVGQVSCYFHVLSAMQWTGMGRLDLKCYNALQKDLALWQGMSGGRIEYATSYYS